MKTIIALLLTCVSVCAQTTPYMVQLLQKPNAISARAYLGIPTSGLEIIAAGTNIVLTKDFQGRTVINAASGGAGSGTVTSFSAGSGSPLFTTSVANPTTTPALSFNFLYVPLASNDVDIVNALGTTPVNNATSAINAGTATNVVGGVIQNVTNAGQGNLTLISTSNQPTVSLKSLTSGANVTLTDQGGTNIQISSTGGGGGGSSIDLPMTNNAPYANGTNYFIDFGFQSQLLLATNDLTFNYSTNWSSSAATSRVATVIIPATNFLRHVLFVNAATNWHLAQPVYNIPPMRGARMVFQVFGLGESNVSVATFIDSKNSPLLSQVFSVSTVTSATNLLIVDATRDVYQDNLFTITANDGSEIRGWKDESGKANNLTNFTGTINSIYLREVNSSPFNVPSLEIQPPLGSVANTWLRSPSVSTLTQPVYVFIMLYTTKGSSTVFDALSGTTTRIDCQPAIPTTTIASQNASSFTATVGLYNSYELFTFVFNGVSSSIRTNGATAATGSLNAATANGFTFGSDVVSTVPVSRTYVPEVMVFWGALTGADLGNIETNYFRAKYRTW